MASFYINGEFYDSVEMKNEILNLSTNEIYIGAGTDEKVNKDFFYGLISDVEIYDIALSDDETFEISKPSKTKS